MECKHESFGRKTNESSMYYLWLRRRRTLKRRPARWREAWAYSWLHQLSFFKLGVLLFSINIREASTGFFFFCLTNEKEKVKRILKNVLLSILSSSSRDGKWNDLVRSKRRASFLDDAYFVKFKEFFSAFPFVSKKQLGLKKVLVFEGQLVLLLPKAKFKCPSHLIL